MNKLLPCPFCGAKESKDNGATGVYLWPLVGEKYRIWLVQCECGARAHFKFTKKDAIAMWNMRTGVK
jgi:Lar family restriction alleviation protein